MSLVPLLALLLIGCGPAADPLNKLDKKYTSIMVRLGAAYRDNARNVRNSAALKRKVQAERKQVAFFRDERVQATIDEVRASNSVDPAVKSKAEAYWREMLQARSWTPDEKQREARLLGRLDEARATEAEWQSSDGKHRVSLDRGWSSVSRIADDLDQAERDGLARQYVEHKMGLVAQDLQDLVRLRNGIAQREGFANYWELSLARHGLTPQEVDQIIDELSVVVAPINAAINEHIRLAAETSGLADTFANRPLLRRRAKLALDRNEASAYFDADLAEDRIITAFQDMGISTQGWQVYTGPPRYVRPGAYSFPIRPPEHVAIVMSQRDRWSLWCYEALAHEGGLAVWYNGLSDAQVGSPPIWAPPAPWFEGIAQFFERLVSEPDFLVRYVPELPKKDRKGLAEWRTQNMANWITRSIIQTLVERRLYEDPNNLEAITRYASEIRNRYQGAPTPFKSETNGLYYDSSLLSSILWNYPAYSQNYLFAYMTEAWLYETVTQQIGPPVANTKLGPLIRDKLIRVSADVPFPDRIAALNPGDRIAPLKAYIQGPPPLPTAPSDD